VIGLGHDAEAGARFRSAWARVGDVTELPELLDATLGVVSPPIAHVLQFFSFAHLPEGPVRDASRLFTTPAVAVAVSADNPETTVALRKLLEAKDATVRATLLQVKKEKAEAERLAREADAAATTSPEPS
jgi:hypothetical protein